MTIAMAECRSPNTFLSSSSLPATMVSAFDADDVKDAKALWKEMKQATVALSLTSAQGQESPLLPMPI